MFFLQDAVAFYRINLFWDDLLQATREENNIVQFYGKWKNCWGFYSALSRDLPVNQTVGLRS